MPAPIIPWRPSNIPLEIQEELDRRKAVRNFNFISNQKASWNEGGDWNTYKGPMTPWVRMCSNGAGHPAIKKPRFVFRGGKGFYDTYGFRQDSPNSSKYQIIGYMPTNPPIPHIIENSLKNPSLNGQEQSNFPIHVPTPEINKITVTVQKELFRRAQVEWTCFSWEQLVYMTPYFMIPRISVMLEWGWNHFNPRSLVPLEDETQMAKLWRNAYPLYTQNIILSKGNYDVLYGFITNFNFSMEGNRINCVTEITSKDRLYAGISKDMGLTVNDNSQPDAPRPIFQALRDFISKDATFQNIQSIAQSEPGTELLNLTGGQIPISGSLHGAETQNVVWRDILSPILTNPDPKIRGMKVPYIHGVFSGRPKKFWNYPNAFGKPQKYDFDKSTEDKIVANKIWINMGLIVEILNYFSGLPGGKGEPMFQVDILNSVIGGHPNMISCNRDVLIPNSRAPKFHFGTIGMQNYGPASGDTTSPYRAQQVLSQKVSSPADITLRRVCYQNVGKVENDKGPGGNDVCYRNNLDRPINFLRYNFKSSTDRGLGYLGHTNYMESFSFPATVDTVLPPSDNGLGAATTSSPNAKQGNVVEADISGLLSDIYISYSAFSSIIMEPDSKTASYVDIYNRILLLLNSAVDDFWALTLVEVDGVMTIMDRNYLGTQNKLGQSDPTYSFDYFDSDSIIRAFRFHPTLTDAQATRAIYGEVNNTNSKYVYVDKNDLLDYKFKDAIILNEKDATQGDPKDDVNKRQTAINQIHDIIGEAQKLNTQEGDDSIQMTVNKGGSQTQNNFIATPSGLIPVESTSAETGPFEILKFCIPSSVAKQLFRLLIDDHDENNNNRYCAIQPGITAELTLQGIGGLRTFQYFLIKNLPAPYSHRDIIFRITNVEQTVTQEGGGWDTKVTAGILPLRKYIKNRLAPPKGGWAEPTNATL